MTTVSDSPATTRRSLSEKIIIAVVSFGLVLIVVAYAFSRPPRDFLEYWTAAKLLLPHKNPYSLPDAFWVQKSLGWDEPVPLMFASPPWALSYLAPLGLIRSYAIGWLFWVTMLTVSTAVSSRFLMHLYFGETQIPEVSDSGFHRNLFAFTFYPSLLALKFAQTAPLLLLGLTGFLFFHCKQRLFRAGVFLSLTLIKPHLLYLIWIAVVLWCWRRRVWTPAISASLVTALLTTFALLIDPHAFRQYWEFVRGPYLALNPSAIVAVLRNALKRQATFAWQFAPLSVGLIWFAYYWRKHRRQWNWTERMPALVTVCMLTTPYGWLFDQTLLVVPIIAFAGALARKEKRLPRNAVLLFTALNVVLIFGAMASSPWTYLPAPILFAVLLWRRSRMLRAEPSSSQFGAA